VSHTWTDLCKPPFCAVWLLLLGVVIFAGLAVAVRNHVTDESDLEILSSLRDPEHPKKFAGPPLVRNLLNDSFDVTALGGVAVLTILVVLVAIYLLLCRQWLAAGLLVVAAVSGSLANRELKALLDRPRPPASLQLRPVHSTSFPSGHAMSSAVIYLTLAGILSGLVTGRARCLFLWLAAVLLTGLVGFSRVALGAHYPTDVVGGWSAGLAVAMFWWLVFFGWRRRSSARGLSTNS
jgi:undecaprenyl-diphosphatase